MPSQNGVGAGANFSFGMESFTTLPTAEKAVGKMRWPGAAPEVEEDEPEPPEGYKAAFAKLKTENRELLAGSRAVANKEPVRIIKALHGDNKKLTKKMASKEEREYDHLVHLTQEKDALRDSLAETRTALKTAQTDLLNANSDSKKSTDALEKKCEELQQLGEERDKLKKDLTKEEAATKDVQEQVTALYADVEQAHAARQAALEARDEARIQQRNQELQFNELNEQWQDTKARVTELEQMLEDMEALEENTADLSHDIARLREEAADHERTIVVKDERISHLETQYQKERQRNIASVEEQARAAAASPIDEGPQHVSNIGDSLESELEGEDFCYVGEHDVDEPNELSAITKTLLTYSPIAPATEPPRTFHQQVVASTLPIAPATEPPRTFHQQVAASTLPIASAAPAPLALSKVRKAASTSPRAATVPQQTTHIRDAASTSPKEPTPAPSSLSDVCELASIAPFEPTPAPSALSNVHELASITPFEPVPAPSTLIQHEVANYPPRQTHAQLLTVNVKEAASISPIERQTSTTDLSTQTDAPEPTVDFSTQTDAPDVAHAPELTSQLLHHATLDTAPMELTEIATIDRSMQTNTQQLGITILEDAIDVSPIEPVMVEPAETSEAGFQMDTRQADIGVQTMAKPNTAIGTQTTSASTNNRMAPVKVIHEIAPVHQTVPEVVAKSSSTTDATEPVEIAPPMLNTTSKLPRLSDHWKIVFIAGLFLWCVSLWSELAQWKTANGVGFGNGYSNMASRNGAYGNGRHFLGIFPMGIDIGNSWWSEQVARQMSMAVARFENWAGLAYEPHY
jgi:hypothetical protein